MSDIGAESYGYPVAVTASDAVNDPSGPFQGLLVSVAGTLRVTPYGGPQAQAGASPGYVAFTVVAGQYVRFPVRRVWSTGTSATVIGLCAGAGPIKPGS